MILFCGKIIHVNDLSPVEKEQTLKKTLHLVIFARMGYSSPKTIFFIILDASVRLRMSFASNVLSIVLIL